MLDSMYFKGSSDYKETYYRLKFDIDSVDADSFLTTVKDYFVEGIIWNLRYYYQGCDSWEWFYPFYYAPFPSDLRRITHLQSRKFETGKPFSCLEQLMAVLPPYSSHAIPETYRELMFSTDSEIIDFYPKTFKVDLVGKKAAWLGEVLLPMIDEIRLKNALLKKDPQLSDRERKRNNRGTYLFFHNSEHSGGSVVQENCFKEIKGKFKKTLLKGNISRPDELQDCIQIYEYVAPDYEGHRCNLLDGVIMPPKYLPENFADYENKSKITEDCIMILERSLKNLDRRMRKSRRQKEIIDSNKYIDKDILDSEKIYKKGVPN